LLNTLIPNIFLKVSENSGFNENYPTDPHKNCSTKPSYIDSTNTTKSILKQWSSQVPNPPRGVNGDKKKRSTTNTSIFQESRHKQLSAP
jgi:hypothetical protein